jgi:glycosyltransferase involved in cell wall biosynthesis
MQQPTVLRHASSPDHRPQGAVGPATNTVDSIPTGSRWREAPSVSVVVPCHNEARNLAQLLPLLSDVLNRCAAAWEVVLVDDGSSDSTADLLRQWGGKGGFRFIQLSRNFGKEAALTAGMQLAVGEVVVFMDADMQHSPLLIPVFLAHWTAGADMVYAVRQDREDESPLKQFGAKWFYRLINGASRRFDVPAGAGDFRLMDRQVVDSILALPERNRFMKGLYAWVGFKSVAVPYQPDERHHGQTRFGLLRLIGLSLDGLTAFTTWPLRAVSTLGFAMAFCSFAYGAFLTLRYLMYGHAVSGWTTIVVSLMLFAGIQLVSLGVVGEYIGRIFEEVKGRPLFIVKEQGGRGMKGASR